MPKYIPQPGDVVTTPQVAFPMTVEAVNQSTCLCALAGFDPDTNQLVQLPDVCLMEVQPVEAAN
jgi:hypothetical protein